MRKGGGKAKGSSFEREICRRLSLWISHGSQEDVFWRSALSGGRATVAAKKGLRLATQAGDISAIHPLGNAFIEAFMVECKNYADLKFEGLITGKGHLAEFWVTAKNEAIKYGKLPMLIAKQNQQPSIVFLDRKGLDVLVIKLKCCLTAPRLNLYAVLLDEFLLYAKFVGEV